MTPSYGKHGEANFVFPVRVLESDRLKVVPILCEEDWQELYEPFRSHPEFFNYFFFAGWATQDEFINHYRKNVLADPTTVVFKCYDKTGTGEERLCGTIGLINTEVHNQCTEIGYVIVFPEFRRTHVTTYAVGLLLHFCLELPASVLLLAREKNDSQSTRAINGIKRHEQQPYGPGLGFRRVQWQAHADNIPSVRTAERMGFRREGLIRWQRTIDPRNWEFGLSVPAERAALSELPGRHSWMLSCCWDDWELEGAREHVQEQMNRR